MVFAGTSGLVLPVPNKASFPKPYQDKSRLNYYSSLFNSIEINSSFYKIPLASTVLKWAGDVPDDFRFTFKLWKGITHNKQLAFNSDDVRKFIGVINNAGDKKGCLLIQFPKSTTITEYTGLRSLLEVIGDINTIQWKIAIEFRSTTWYIDEVYELLNEHKAGLVLHDMPSSHTPMANVTGDFIYLRFHGPDGGYRGSYTDDFLSEYVSYIKEWQQEGKAVYCYFNNTMGDALKNLTTLNSLINGRLSDRIHR